MKNMLNNIQFFRNRLHKISYIWILMSNKIRTEIGKYCFYNRYLLFRFLSNLCKSTLNHCK